MSIETLGEHRSFGGTVGFYRHRSEANNCDMRFSVFMPPAAAEGRVPVLTYLAGLTCTEETFMIKAGAQRLAAELGIMLVAPDTSPRGEGVPDDPEGAYDFGLGAGFYVNASEALEKDTLALHHRLAGQCTDVAQAEHRGAVGDNRHQVATVGVLVGQLRVLLDLQAGLGHTWRVGQREIALGHTGLGRDDLGLSVPLSSVIGKCLVTGDLLHLILSSSCPPAAIRQL